MKALAAVSLLFGIYFPMAIWLEHNFKGPEGPVRPLPVLGVSAGGSCVSRVWLPKEMNKVAVYDGNVRVGYAIKVYDDPDRLDQAINEKRWKLVEFFECESKQSWPNLHGLGISPPYVSKLHDRTAEAQN
jgi:hypothetical protein